jgi:hypothetical protein
MYLYMLLMMLVAGWCALLVLQRRRFKQTRKEISRLPKFTHQGFRPAHPIEGSPAAQIETIVPLPSDVLQGPSVIVVVSTTCPYCRQHLEEFAERFLPKNPVPAVCLVTEVGHYPVDVYVKLYGQLFPMIPITEEMARTMQVGEFPSFLLVDANGIIRAVVHDMIQLDKQAARLLQGEEASPREWVIA